MTDIRDATPIGEPKDDSGGYCCVAAGTLAPAASAGVHMGHDEDCPGYLCPLCEEIRHDDPEFGVCRTCLNRIQADDGRRK